MANEMIERVARSLNPTLWEELDRNSCNNSDFWKQRSVAQARAAIEAMREPTEAMEDAAASGGSIEVGSSAYGCWQTMIDEALK